MCVAGVANHLQPLSWKLAVAWVSYTKQGASVHAHFSVAVFWSFHSIVVVAAAALLSGTTTAVVWLVDPVLDVQHT